MLIGRTALCFRSALTLAAVLAGSGLPVVAGHGGHDERALAADPRLAEGPIAPVLEGLGHNHFAITTKSERAQQFFDQGLLLTYGFNHQEALRAFKEAARLDPSCAMAYWGWALVLGPNLNLPMRTEVVAQAHEAIGLALERVEGVTPKERALVEALAKRYTDDPEADRAPYDAAYADAMAKVHAAYPDDPDVATLYAAALMNLSPWNYWTGDGRPRGKTLEAARVLEKAMARDPQHEGALHYYIHLVEPVDPRRGEHAADSLRGLAPGAGHLTHMPSHIYMQTGRYAEAFDANVLASKADEGYITQCRAQGIYPLNYYPHNVHFLAWAALMEGRGADALAAARKVAARVPEDMHGNDWALYQTFLGMPLFAMVRFGMWEAILSEPAPPDELLYWNGMWHYARGMAFARTGRFPEGGEELAALRKISDDPRTGRELTGFSNASRLLTIAREVLMGEIAAGRGEYDPALLHAERAVRLEAGLQYNEPPDWYYPVRHTLGAILLEAGRPDEAEVVYNEDLRRYPDNGWSLFGLWQALTAQGRQEEAKAVRERFERAWSRADVRLTASRL